MKLVVTEPETPSLRAHMSGRSMLSSELVVAEVLRAVRRRPGPPGADHAARLLEGVGLAVVDGAILRAAGALAPTTLRTLDAVHVATAVLLAGAYDAVLTYDQRMVEAMVAQGLPVQSPGARQ